MSSVLTPTTEGMIERPAPSFWAIAPVVAVAAFMEVLDLSIANVALLHIAGSLSASQDQATWVLTAYTVTNAIILPLSGWLATTLGRKRYFMGSIGTFSLASLLCGLAPSLGALVFFRALQGLVGGGLQPNAQAILSDAAPPEKRGMAFALYGMAVVLAPAIGPTLGGWITYHMNWRWVFLINVPVGILLLPFIKALVRDPPHLVQARRARRAQGLKLDYIGFSLIALGLGCLQIVLDRGQQNDWFASTLILAMTGLAAVTLVGFVVWEWTRSDPIVDLHLLKNPTFAVANLLMFMLGFVLLGTTVLLPLYVQSLMGYTPVQAGLMLSPGGLAILFLMPVVGHLVSRVDARWLISAGFLIIGVAMLLMTRFDTETGFQTIMWTRVLQASGMAFLFIPINTVAFAAIDSAKSSNASAIINMSRNIGGSFGISIAITLLARGAQIHQNRLIGRVTSVSPALRSYVATVRNHLAAHGHGGIASAGEAMGFLYQTVVKQSTMLAYIDDFRFLGVVSILLIPSVFFLRRSNDARTAPPGSVH
ncbi:MAG: DHA2 family efflux MFS transporter permease subunit [Gammaproteobacteria bacterium]